MHQEAENQGLKKEERIGGIIFDEMSIQEDLTVTHSGQNTYFSGLVDMGNLGNSFLQRRRGNYNCLCSITCFISGENLYWFSVIALFEVELKCFIGQDMRFVKISLYYPNLQRPLDFKSARHNNSNYKNAAVNCMNG